MADKSSSASSKETLNEEEANPAAVDSATELVEPPPPDITDMCRDTFTKTSEYLKGELTCTSEDYKLMEQMNKATMTKYIEMKTISASVSRAMKELNEKYQSLQPYLDQIDQIEESVASLEQAAYKLDAYSKRLEAKFKQLDKK